MNLLDTHVFAWAVNDPDKLSEAARNIVTGGDWAVSCASLWEMLAKKGRPTALVADPLPWWNSCEARFGVRVLPISPRHVMHLDVLPGPIRDPFDRILIAQCITEGLRLVTADEVIRTHYQTHVSVVW